MAGNILAADGDVDLEALDAFLMSDRAPQDAMMMSDLDGFLTGIAVGPELLLPSEWLPVIWGAAAPEFSDEAEARAVLGAIMGRYNEVLRQIEENDLDPVFWSDRDGMLIASDWAEGFLQAVMMRADAWEPLFKSEQDCEALFPILALCGDERGNSLLGLEQGDEDVVMAKAPDLIPASVMAIAAYWRGHGAGKDARPLSPEFGHAAAKVDRDDPCPCGSGKKFKKCCGEIV